MLTERDCRWCHEAASHYLNGNIRGGSRNFASSKLENFAIIDSRLLDASDCHKRLKCKNIYIVKLPKLISPVAQLIKTDSIK